MIDKKKVTALCDEWLAGREYFLVDVQVSADNRIVVEIDHKDGVWIDDCCDLSRHIEEGLDRDVEDFELEVGSAGISAPFKVVQQYVNAVDTEVEVMPKEGKKITGLLTSADDKGFTVKWQERQQVDGKKRKQLVDVERTFAYGEPSWVKSVIKF